MSTGATAAVSLAFVAQEVARDLPEGGCTPQRKDPQPGSLPTLKR
jgi:hypothetical protein